MEKKSVVVFLGDSLLMDGIAASLAKDEAFKSIRWDPAGAKLDAFLQSTMPDLIFFELDSSWSSAIFALLSKRPGLMLLGLDLNCSRVIVMNSHQRYTKSIAELSKFLQDEVHTEPRT